MPNRAKTPCRKPGCPNYGEVYGGYCAAHSHLATAGRRDGFKKLDRKKLPEHKRFYSSARWTKASIRHRRNNPLCKSCNEKGIIVPVTLTHHDPPLSQLLAEGKDPYADEYLVSSCNECHLDELRNKRGEK